MNGKTCFPQTVEKPLDSLSHHAKEAFSNLAVTDGSGNRIISNCRLERHQELDYDFLRANLKESVGTALRFALSVPGVHTAIVGTANPERWMENAKLLEAGMLPESIYNSIRTRWKETAGSDWIGQV